MRASRALRRLKILLAVLFVVLAGLLLCRAGLRESLRQRTAITTPGGIEALEPIELGGVRQWLLIRGEDRHNPVLLWLHGGPGTTTMPFAHRYDTELVRHFVVVHWDQRGAGKSWTKDLGPGQLTTERYLADTLQLVRYLRTRFGVEKIYLLGHSWGGTLAVLAAARHPELFHALICVGPSISLPEGQAFGYRNLLARAHAEGNRKALAALERIGPPPWDARRLAVYTRWETHYHGFFRRVTLRSLASVMLLSPAYSLGDAWRWVRGAEVSAAAMVGELNRIDLVREVPRLDVPVYVFVGRYDLATPGPLAERYLKILQAPRKSLTWFEHSAHFPMWEEPGKFNREMLRVLAETGGRAPPGAHHPALSPQRGGAAPLPAPCRPAELEGVQAELFRGAAAGAGHSLQGGQEHLLIHPLAGLEGFQDPERDPGPLGDLGGAPTRTLAEDLQLEPGLSQHGVDRRRVIPQPVADSLPRLLDLLVGRLLRREAQVPHERAHGLILFSGHGGSLLRSTPGVSEEYALRAGAPRPESY